MRMAQVSIADEFYESQNSDSCESEIDLIGSSSRLDADPIIDRVSDSLLAAQVFLGGLDRHMSKQKLDLLQVTTSNMA